MKYFFSFCYLVVLLVVTDTQSATAQSFDCSSVTTVAVDECNALISYYNETDGPNWTLSGVWANPSSSDGWLVAANPCDWYGVLCWDGHVAGIMSENNNLSGAFPMSLFEFPKLEAVILGKNNLTGCLPENIGDLAGGVLVQLAADNNSFECDLPASLWNLTKMKVFILHKNSFTGTLTGIGNMRELLSVALNDNNFSGDIDESFWSISTLESVDVAFNPNITGGIHSSVGALQSINFLTVAGTGMSGQIPQEIVNSSLWGFHFRDTLLEAPSTGEFAFWFAGLRSSSESGLYYAPTSTSTSVENEELAKGFALMQNYPNPFNPTTTVQFEMGSIAEVSLTVHNMLGQRVATLNEGTLTPDTYSRTLELSNRPSGIYFARMTVDGNLVATKTMMLLK